MDEFMDACTGKDGQEILGIIDNLMHSLKEILPWKYEETIEAIKRIDAK